MKKNLFLLIVLLISLSLYSQEESQPILFSVSVTGMVENPGVYHLLQTSRVSEAIISANPIKMNLLTEELDTQLAVSSLETLDFDDIYIPKIENKLEYSTRNVILKRQGESIVLDMEAFYSLGDIDNNPYLKDGDIIYVPPKKHSIEISGEVNKPGNIELNQSDYLEDIINLAQDFTPFADTRNIQISRRNHNTGELEEITVDYRQENITLFNRDYIKVNKLKNYKADSYISIYGNIEDSGKYPIINNKTTLLEVLNKIEPDITDIDLANSFIQRTNKNDIPDPEFERLKLLRPLEMTYIEYQYFKTTLNELKGKFSVDLVELYNNQNSDLNVVLKDADFIYFEAKKTTVLISGNVNNPGLIEYTPDKNYLYYLEKAGGLSWNAKKSKIRIIRGNSEEWLKPDKNIILNPGDIVFVPEKPETNYWKIFKELIVVLSQIGTLILVIDNATTK